MSEEQPEIVNPRLNTRFFGHEEAVSTIEAAIASGKMPHAWLISGARGTGKATLAWRFARAMLSGTNSLELEESHPVFRRIAAGSHTDLLTVEPAYDDEKEEQKQEISVELARQIPGFLALTPAESDWRVVIIDSADELNVNAANAILKTLEEPPPRSILLLISHNPGSLLPTIRSRCRQLKLKPLSAEAFRKVIRTHQSELSFEEIDAFAALSGNSPGVALSLIHSEAMDAYLRLIRLIGGLEKGRFERADIVAFVDKSLSGNSLHARWKTLGYLFGVLLSRASRYAITGEKIEEICPGEGAAIAALEKLAPAPELAAREAAITQQFSLAARLHLDYKTVLITFLHELERPHLKLSE